MSDPDRKELLDMAKALNREHGLLAEEFDIEEACYWFAADYHGGQFSDLYEALCASPFRPGATQTRPSHGAAELIYTLLKRRFAS